MKCPNCEGENVTLSREENFNIGANTPQKVEVVNTTRSHGCVYWVFIGWWKFLVFDWWWNLLFGRRGGGFSFGANKTVMHTVAVCSDCGHTWTVKNEKKRGRGCLIAVIVVVVLGIIGALSGGDSDDSGLESTTERKETSVSAIEDFDYEISGDEIILDSYDGDAEILTIETEYEVGGETYTTNLEDFQVSDNDVKTIIFAEGISEVRTSVFNSCDVTTIYFPTTMTCVYDYTLAYLDSDEETIQIYYGGTEGEWNEIFTEYENTSFSEAEGAEAKGESLANSINEAIGVEYDASEFEYNFSANPEEL